MLSATRPSCSPEDDEHPCIQINDENKENVSKNTTSSNINMQQENSRGSSGSGKEDDVVGDEKTRQL